MKQHLLAKPDNTDRKIGGLLASFNRKIRAYPPGMCPLTVQLSLLQASKSLTCGKCVPCREGLVQLEELLKQILDGGGSTQTLQQMKELAEMIYATADCAIGYEAAQVVLKGLEEFRDEYISHIYRHMCQEEIGQTIPCVTMCPAHVDIPGYIALIAEQDYAGAVAMVRKDNPFPTACAMICEHPCEERCRRNLIDDQINIRALKKYDGRIPGTVQHPAGMPPEKDLLKGVRHEMCIRDSYHPAVFPERAVQEVCHGKRDE